jgi:group I intron endonuclease
MSYIIYKASTPNGKCYIGFSSKSLEERKKKHYTNANQKTNRPFLDAIRKFGNSIKWEIIAVYETKMYALNRESYFISLYQSRLDQNGYNYTSGGEGRTGPINRNKHSRLVINQDGKIFNSLAEAGRSVGSTGDQVLTGIRDRSIVKGTSFSFYQSGMDKSEIYKDKRYIAVTCDQNGKTYKSMAEAARDLNITLNGIQKVISGKRKSYKKMTFKIANTGGGLFHL